MPDRDRALALESKHPGGLFAAQLYDTLEGELPVAHRGQQQRQRGLDAGHAGGGRPVRLALLAQQVRGVIGADGVDEILVHARPERAAVCFAAHRRVHLDAIAERRGVGVARHVRRQDQMVRAGFGGDGQQAARAGEQLQLDGGAHVADVHGAAMGFDKVDQPLDRCGCRCGRSNGVVVGRGIALELPAQRDKQRFVLGVYAQ